MKSFMKNLTLFLVFGWLYFAIECLWKGHISHWTMFALGGFVGVLIGGINEIIPWEMPFPRQCILGMCIATLCEGLSGILLNICLGLNIWRYNILPFFMGQCSIPFCLAWLVLAGLCIVLDDVLRYILFGEEEPHYTWR